jgi:hypothetical protein
MSDNFKYNLLHNWSFMRSLRLVLGVIAITQAFMTFEILIGLAGVILLGQAVFNIGCCGTAGCNTTRRSNTTSNNEEIIYEEIK